MRLVEATNDAQCRGESVDGASRECERAENALQAGPHLAALLVSDPRRDAVDLPPRVCMPGNGQDSGAWVAIGRDGQEERRAVAGHEKGGERRVAESFVQPVYETRRQARLRQVRKERLANRIRVGADHDPNRSKEEDVHPLVISRTASQSVARQDRQPAIPPSPSLRPRQSAANGGTGDRWPSGRRGASRAAGAPGW